MVKIGDGTILLADTYYPVGENSVLYIESERIAHILVCDAGEEPERDRYFRIEY